MGYYPSQTDLTWISLSTWLLQFFQNCSNMGLYHKVHPSGVDCSSTNPPWVAAPTRPPTMGSSVGCNVEIYSTVVPMGFRETPCSTRVLSTGELLLQHLQHSPASSFTDLGVYRIVSLTFFSFFSLTAAAQSCFTLFLNMLSQAQMCVVVALF